MSVDLVKRAGIWALWIGFLALPFMEGWAVAPLIAVFCLIILSGFLRRACVPPRVRSVYSHWKRRLGKSLEKIPWRAILAVGLLLLPLGLNSYFVDVLTLAGLYALLALGLNITVGYAGLLDLGYAAFYAVGAYLYAILSTRIGLPFWLGLPIGGIGAGIAGMLLGMITLRLRGDYLAIVTLGFLQIVHLVLNNWDSVTNGPNGILNVGRPVLPLPGLGWMTLHEPIHFYYLILFLIAIVFFAVRRLDRSWVGRAWIAIREDELAAELMGINTTGMKILAFTLGALVAGVAGVFFAGRFAFVSPESFTFFESVIILSMVVLGGMGSLPGVIIGAVVLVLLPEIFREFSSYRMLIFGAALVLMMIFRPQGIVRSAQN
jgi:branched-chain amino acid transport system permease protein